MSGALIARVSAAVQPREDQLPTRTRVVVGMVAASFPDADFFMRYIDFFSYLAYHRIYIS